jgi:hypothetical protein
LISENWIFLFFGSLCILLYLILIFCAKYQSTFFMNFILWGCEILLKNNLIFFFRCNFHYSFLLTGYVQLYQTKKDFLSVFRLCLHLLHFFALETNENHISSIFQILPKFDDYNIILFFLELICKLIKTNPKICLKYFMEKLDSFIHILRHLNQSVPKYIINSYNFLSRESFEIDQNVIKNLLFLLLHLCFGLLPKKLILKSFLG